jgi:hypothetical protein
MKNVEHTQWFDDHAKTLASSSNPRFSLTYFLTGDSSNTTKTSTDSPEGSVSIAPLKGVIDSESGLPCKEKDSAKITTIASGDTIRGLPPALKYQKLNLEETVLGMVRSVGKDQRVLVACCGPDRMMRDIRNAVAQCLTAEGPSITLHCESFSW